MKDKTKLIDIAKNCAIILLSISAVFLLFKAVVDTPVSSLENLSYFFGGKDGNGTSSQTDDESSEQAAYPLFLLTTTDDGSHYAVKYDSQSKEKIISQFSAYLGEALGSSGNLEEVSEAQLQKALSGSGVFFDYLYPMPLSAIASWLGTEITGEASLKTARRLFLGDDNGTLILYFISENDNKIYSCETALRFSSLSTKIAEYPIGTANFAFELGEECKSIDPYFIFSHESDTLRAVTASNPLRDSGFDGADLLSLFGMNSHIVSEYGESDGSKAYVDGEKSLRLESSGMVLFSVTGDNGIKLDKDADSLEITDCISECYKIIENSIGLMSGDGVVGLIGVTGASSPSSCTINFGYSVDGIPVTLPEGIAASFKISEGAIIKAELYYREYAFSGGTVVPLPEKQATEIAKSKGGEPVLTYEDKNESVNCIWIIN